MTYRELKRKVLELINQYSVAGTAISPDYNNQADYILRVPGLINDALLRIRTEGRPFIQTQRLTESGGKYGSMRSYRLPSDYRGIRTGGVYRISADGTFAPTADYRLIGEKTMLLPDDGSEYVIEYYASPHHLIPNPSDDYEADEDPEVLTAACYFAAAMLIADKNEYHYATLYNEFLRRLEGMELPPTAEISQIADVYGW